MNFAETIQDIKKIYKVLVDKDFEVFTIYKGNGLGITTPWLIRIDSREVNAVSPEQGAEALFIELKKELANKIKFLESQASAFQKTLNTFN